MELKNDFFNKKVSGPVKEISLQKMIEMKIGYRMFMSKRLAPAGVVCNARIYTENNEFVYSSDLNVIEKAKDLTEIAREYGTELFIVHESGNKFIWRSSEPGMYYSFDKKEDGAWDWGGRTFDEVIPELEAHAKQMQRSWLLDRKMVRRTPKEYWKDMQFNWEARDVILENCRAGGKGFLKGWWIVLKMTVLP